MSRFSQYVSTSVKDNKQHIQDKKKKDKHIIRKSPSNLNMPRRPMTLLESKPLLNGLSLSQSQYRKNFDVANSYSSIHRE